MSGASRGSWSRTRLSAGRKGGWRGRAPRPGMADNSKRPPASQTGGDASERAGGLAGQGAFVVAPPGAAFLGEGVDRVVVGVLAGEGQVVACLDAGAVVLGPVGDAARGVVAGDLVDPALADVGDVADHA